MKGSSADRDFGRVGNVSGDERAGSKEESRGEMETIQTVRNIPRIFGLLRRLPFGRRSSESDDCGSPSGSDNEGTRRRPRENRLYHLQSDRDDSSWHIL